VSQGWDAFIEAILGFLRGFGGSRDETGPGPPADTSGEGRLGEEEAGPREVLGEPVFVDREGENNSEERRKTMLEGKGVWAYRRQELDRAIQIAPQMGATHILYKVGQGADYYEGMAEVAQKIAGAGLIPFAWTFVLLDDPEGEAQVVVRAFQDGFRGFIFDTESRQCRNRFEQATQLGQYLRVAGLDFDKLYNCSFPNISHHRDLPYDQMNEYCKGGLMPMSYGTYFLPESTVPHDQQAQRVIDEWTYGHYDYWCLRWGYRPPLYPVLGPYHDEHGSVRMSPAEFQIWLDRLAAHEPTFFSVFTAAVINDNLLPLIQACPLGEAAEPVITGIKLQVVSPEVGFLNVRPEPSTEKPPIARVDDGGVMEALEPDDDVRAKVGQEDMWLHVRTPAGVAGYVAAWYVRLYQEPVEAGVLVEVVSPEVGFLNVRPEPSTDHLPITRVDDGTLVDALEPEATVRAKVGQEGQWLHIRTPAGVEGYVAASYLRLPGEEVVGEPIHRLAVQSDIGLNVRRTPSTGIPPIWRVVDKTVLEVREDPNQVGEKVGKDQWIKIETPSRHAGYVNGLYVRARTDPDDRKPVDDASLPAGECAWIFGIHAAGATTPADFRFLFRDKNKTGWVLFTEAIGADPNHGGGHDYSPWSQDHYGVIVRLNHGYEPAGTLPVHTKYGDFAKACARYIQNSQGCHIWVIGNEQNNVREHPGGADHPKEHITAERYAEAFNLARQRIKDVQSEAIVVAGAVDPYNTFPWAKMGNKRNRPLEYFKEMLDHIDDLDGIALHTYTHWMDVELITKLTVFEDDFLQPGTTKEHYYDFQAYRPFAEAIPEKWRDRPLYLTESDHWLALERPPQNDEEKKKIGWVNKDKGWVQAAYAEIQRWNSTPHAQQIHCFLLYRWTGDKWAIERLGEIHKDFKKSLDHDYRWRR
jgi:hypothetical protein